MYRKLTDTTTDKESGLFALLFLLDYQGYVYFDDDYDDDILSLEKHLLEKKVNFIKGESNRKYLSTVKSNNQ